MGNYQDYLGGGGEGDNLEEIMPLFAPKYDPAYTKLSVQFKERLSHGDFSEDMRLLAEKIIKADPSNYNAWYAKRMHMFQHNTAILDQRYFADSCLVGKAKSFQVWQQKRLLSEKHGDYQSQLPSVDKVLNQIDNKNYHAWSFRVWLVTQGNFYEKQLDFVDKMICGDLYNNSCWSYRFYLIKKIGEKKNQQEKKELYQEEIQYVLKKIEECKSNRAAWNYLRGMFPSIQLKNISSTKKNQKTPLESFTDFPNILSCCTEWIDALSKEKEQGVKQQVARVMAEREILCTMVHIYSQEEDSKHLASNICDRLIEKDTQRSVYWRWVQASL